MLSRWRSSTPAFRSPWIWEALSFAITVSSRSLPPLFPISRYASAIPSVPWGGVGVIPAVQMSNLFFALTRKFRVVLSTFSRPRRTSVRLSEASGPVTRLSSSQWCKRCELAEPTDMVSVVYIDSSFNIFYVPWLHAFASRRPRKRTVSDVVTKDRRDQKRRNGG